MSKSTKTWFTIYFFTFAAILYCSRMYYVSDRGVAITFDSWMIVIGCVTHAGLMVLYTTSKITIARAPFLFSCIAMGIGLMTGVVDPIIAYWTIGIAVVSTGLSSASLRITM